MHEELPALYDSRIPFLISVLQTLFATQSAFYGQNSRVQTQLNNYVDELALEAKKGTYHINARLLANNFNPHIDPLTGQMLDSNTALHLQSANLTRSQQQLQQNPANYNLNNNGQILLENTAAAMKFALQANQNMQNSPTTGPHKIVVSDANSPIPSSTAANLHNQGKQCVLFFFFLKKNHLPFQLNCIKNNKPINLKFNHVNFILISLSLSPSLVSGHETHPDAIKVVSSL